MKTLRCSILDAATRDLTADVFDFLHEARALIETGMIHIAYPLARRAFESLSLAVASNLDAGVAAKWQSGTEVKFYHVRKVLASHPMGEADAGLKEAYAFFSEATHPRRGLVAARYLGEGNSFVLGAIGPPELVLLADYCTKTLHMWFWFGAFLFFTYRDVLARHDPEFFKAYHEVAKNAREALGWLGEQYNRLLAQAETARAC
jgi:hypothetical protein